MKRLPLITLLALILLIGCESDNPIDEPKEVAYSGYFEPQPLQNVLENVPTQIPAVIWTYVENTGDPYTSEVPVIFRVVTGNGVFTIDSTVTDSNGRASTILTVTLERGHNGVSISASIGGQYLAWADWYFGIYPSTARIVLNPPTTRLIVPKGQSAELKVPGSVTDIEGSGLSYIDLTGRIERAGGAPVGSLLLHSDFSRNGEIELVYNSNGNFGTETIIITAEVPDIPSSRIEARLTIETVALEDQVSNFRLHALPVTVIIQPGSEEELIVQALATDSDNNPVIGVPVRFSTSLGVIQTDVLTDSTGMAKALWHTGIDPDTAQILANIPATFFSASGSVEVINPIVQDDPLARLAIFSDDERLIARSGTSTEIRVYGETTHGRSVPAGTVIRFELEGSGRFDIDRAVTDANGQAAVNFIVGETLAEAIITAHAIGDEGEEIVSNDLPIRAVAGEAEHLEFTFDPPMPEVGPNDLICHVTDAWGNPVEGQEISFAATIGRFSPPVAVTDALGNAMTIFTADRSGMVEFRIGWPGLYTLTEIMIAAGYPNSIELTADPLNISNEPGYNVSLINAFIRDMNGSNISVPTIVVFELLNQPDFPVGCAFPNASRIDSARTANGIAVTTLTAGSQIGGVLLKAYTWRDPDTVWTNDEHTQYHVRSDTVSTVISTIQVTSGPPRTMDIDIDPRGEDAVGARWELDVALRAYDIDLNPVSGDYRMLLSINPPNLATIDPVDLEGGRAVTTLSYPSSSSLQPIVIRIAIPLEGDTIRIERNYQLPLQRGFVVLNIDPANWQFDRGRPEDTCIVRVWATLRDGHDILVNNAPIIFSTERARLYWRDQVGGRFRTFENNLVRKYTGIQNQNHNEEPGQATVYLRGRMNEFFLDDFSLEVGVRLNATVEGTDIQADPVTVWFTRH